jgi:polysaccharide biosynthesis/export protein
VSKPSHLLGRTHRLLCTLMASATLFAGCASSTLPVAPTEATAPAARYKIGPLDTLQITVWRNPELSGPIPVRPDGFISMPLIGDLKAAGKTPSELSADLKVALAKLVIEPLVTVVVTGFQGIYADQIRVAGDVLKPQSIAYRQDMTVLDLLIQAGGMLETADGNSAVLVRRSEGGKSYRVRLKDLLKRGDISANVSVLPGDILIVPQAVF